MLLNLERTKFRRMKQCCRALGIRVLVLLTAATFSLMAGAVSPDAKSVNVTVTVALPDKSGIGPDGAQRGWKDTLRALMVPSVGRGALVGEIGNDPAATPFFIGADGNVTVPVAGRLYLGLNQGGESLFTGKFEVHVERTSVAAVNVAAIADSSPYNFQPLFSLLDKDLPYRVSDSPSETANPGDLVNIVLLGDEDQITSALKAAGWVKADKTTGDAVLGALAATLNKEVYVALPMSTLYLFGRPQDFGYARAQALQVAQERDHFRLWLAPFKAPQGQAVWAGAATHDVGIERDQRSPDAITHKIDPDIDKERDFIAATLQQAGWVQAIGYLDRPNQVKETTTATGGEIRSDGKTLVIVLKPVEPAK